MERGQSRAKVEENLEGGNLEEKGQSLGKVGGNLEGAAGAEPTALPQHQRATNSETS